MPAPARNHSRAALDWWISSVRGAGKKSDAGEKFPSPGKPIARFVAGPDETELRTLRALAIRHLHVLPGKWTDEFRRIETPVLNPRACDSHACLRSATPTAGTT